MIKIVGGTAQIGLKYGNSKNKVSQKRANLILQRLIKKKINYLDTANAYGLSEYYIGNFCKKNNVNYKIITKLKPFISKKKENIINYIDVSIKKSLKNLNVSIIDYYLIHDIKNLNKKVVSHLLEYKKKGIIKNIGASLYTLGDFKKVKKFKEVDAIQIPFNLIDQQFFDILNSKKKYTIFVRSILLRGNITKTRITLPLKTKYSVLVKELSKLMLEFKKKDYLALSMSFIKSFKNINYIVLGFQNENQLNLINIYNKAIPLKKSQLLKIKESTKNYKKLSKDIDLRNW